jgi:serine/threonine protein kinase
MGAQLTANYGSIQPTFTLDMWKVHSAFHKTTGEKVSLWMLDCERLHRAYSSKAERDLYFDLSLASIQAIRKLRHPRILKILEVLDRRPDIGFASEPVASAAAQGERLHPMDACHICFQVAEALSFLNQEARILHLGLSPSAVLLDEELSAKLSAFQWAVPLSGQVSVSDRILGGVLSELRFKPPEVLSAKAVTEQADVFAFGLFMYSLLVGSDLGAGETPQEIAQSFASRMYTVAQVPADFRPLVESCLALNPAARPSFLQVLQSQAFQSMQMKALRYVDLLLTKDPSDKFKFYKGLAAKIEGFSPTLLKVRLLPAFLSECEKDVRFAPVLLGPILYVGGFMTPDQFLRTIWNRLAPLTNVTKPPEISIALLRHIQTILRKVERPLHKDLVYPIVLSALQSGDSRIHKECLAQIPTVVSEMSENNVQHLLLPRLLDLAGSAGDPANASSAIRCIAECLVKVDHDSFAADALPTLLQVWHRARSSPIAAAIIEVIEKLTAGSDLMMTKAVPLASEIAGAHALEGESRNRLCDWMIATIQKFKNNKSSVTRRTAIADPDNPFGDGKPEPAPMAVERPRTVDPPRPPVPAKQLTSDDIFGPPPARPAAESFGVPQAKPPPTEVSKPSTAVFAGSRQATTDVFGPRPPPPAAAAAPAPDLDVFGFAQAPANRSDPWALGLSGPPARPPQRPPQQTRQQGGNAVEDLLNLF